MVNIVFRDPHVSLHEPRAGQVVSIILSLISMATLSVCLTRRVQNVVDWSKLPPVCWAILLIYSDSIIFVSGTAILSNGFGVGSSPTICSRAILLCLACYVTTKLLFYYFLVERVYIIRKGKKHVPRLKDRLYIFNAIGMLVPYCVVIALNFEFRFAAFQDGSCRIGMKRMAMIPLISFDILVNVYLTSLFLVPLRSLHSFKNNPSGKTRVLALRTFIGSCAALISSVVNLTTLMVLDGEPGWICLMCCNADILFSVLVLHWITAKDSAATLSGNTPVDLRAPPSPTPKRLVPRPPLYDTPSSYKLNSYDTKTQNEHTTFVLASKDAWGEEEIDRIHTYPPNAITVERKMIRLASGNSSGTRISEEQRCTCSEDGLFQKC